MSVMIKVNASDVAALIGKNKFKPKEEAIVDLLVDNNLVDVEVESIQPMYELQSICEFESNEVIQENTSWAKLESSISNYQTKLIETVIQDAVIQSIHQLCDQESSEHIPAPKLSTPIELPTNIQTIVNQKVADGYKNKEATFDIIKNICRDIPKESLKQIKIVSDATSEVIKQRGIVLEETSTNVLETKTGVAIRNRNSKCYVYYLPNTSALIAGRVDGLQGDDTVVETKTRRRFWKSPPEYDIIQLRCYMKLTNRRMGILNECFPDGTSRATTIEWSDSIWNEIQSALTNVIKDVVNTHS